ncbi:hypothetical protein DdX_16700 [Ditylenchus destructor]|uniref:Uncharacterized protein n=1 Tax=Ditylenchus destructor TaxID=166010 RepID=A0AAD4MPX9_9BILA|nr:hypothetical protein DdX_16700 [Ditylenchus destructor]
MKKEEINSENLLYGDQSLLLAAEGWLEQWENTMKQRKVPRLVTQGGDWKDNAAAYHFYRKENDWSPFLSDAN